MAWDTITDLSSSQVTGLHLEQSSLELWYEFLGGYFDGHIHHLEGESLTFPLAKFSFQQGALGTPIDSNSISLTWTKEGSPVRRLWNGTRVTFLKTTWTFYVRSADKNKGSGNADVMIKKVTDLLYSLLANRTKTKPLARKGIHHIRPGQSTLMPNPDVPMRRLEVKAELIFGDSESSLLVTDDDAVLVFDDGSQWSVDAT